MVRKVHLRIAFDRKDEQRVGGEEVDDEIAMPAPVSQDSFGSAGFGAGAAAMGS